MRIYIYINNMQFKLNRSERSFKNFFLKRQNALIRNTRKQNNEIVFILNECNEFLVLIRLEVIF
jgi:hypothetical protein